MKTFSRMLVATLFIGFASFGMGSSAKATTCEAAYGDLTCSTTTGGIALSEAVGADGHYIDALSGASSITDTLSGYLAPNSTITITYAFNNSIVPTNLSAYAKGSNSSGYTSDEEDAWGIPLVVVENPASTSFSGALPILASANIDATDGSAMVVITNLTDSVIKFLSVFEAWISDGCALVVTYHVSSVPLPAGAWLFLSGLMVLGGFAFHKKAAGRSI